MYKSFFLLLLVLAMVKSAHGHDIGVTEVEFVEQEGHKYQLIVNNPEKIDDVIAPPILPVKCDLHISKKKQAVRAKFKINCGDEGLNASDTIVLSWRIDAILVHATWLNGKETRTLFMRTGDVITVPLNDLSATSANMSSLVKRYTALGFEHIRGGTDHLLFVLGIMLLVTSAKTLLKAITAFTFAHSITLALSFLGFLALPSAPVEASIAFSIVVLAYEVVRAANGQIGLTQRFPWLVAGGFGLIHGLGFAGALLQLGVPTAEIPIALLFFNVGVEIGQITFVALVLLAIMLGNQVLQRMSADYRLEKILKIPAAYVMGGIAMYWAIGRSAAIFMAV